MRTARILLALTIAASALDIVAQSNYADLQIREPRIDPPALSTGEGYSVSFVVRNGGGRPAEPYTTFSVSLPSGFRYGSAAFQGTGGITYGCEAGSDAVSCKGNARQPGGTAFFVTMKFQAGNPDSGGGVTIRADSANLVSEPNEHNNTASLTYFPRPDLAVTSLASQPQPARVHQEFAVVTGYKNVGPVAVRYEDVMVTLQAGSTFEIVRTEPTTTFPSGPRTSAEVKFYPGLLNPGAEGTVKVFLRTQTAQRVNAMSRIRNYDSQGRDYETRTGDNTKSLTVSVEP